MVNAQVKAMISLLELSSNVIYNVILSFTVKTSYATLVQWIFLYMILLPYAFLMNTSHNKNRIVEYGWINVFKNLITKITNSVSHDTSNINENTRVYNISGKLQHRENPLTKEMIGNSSQQHDLPCVSAGNVVPFAEPSSSKGTSIPMVSGIQKRRQASKLHGEILTQCVNGYFHIGMNYFSIKIMVSFEKRITFLKIIFCIYNYIIAIIPVHKSKYSTIHDHFEDISKIQVGYENM